MNANMHEIYDAFKDEPDFLIISHTCDPEIDSRRAKALRRFAKSRYTQMDFSYWKKR